MDQLFNFSRMFSLKQRRQKQFTAKIDAYFKSQQDNLRNLILVIFGDRSKNKKIGFKKRVSEDKKLTFIIHNCGLKFGWAGKTVGILRSEENQETMFYEIVRMLLEFLTPRNSSGIDLHFLYKNPIKI